MSQQQFHYGADERAFVTKQQGVPDYKSSWPTSKLPAPVRKVCINTLDLSDEEQMQLYQKIWEAVGIGVVVVAEEERKWLPVKQNWKVYIRWYLLAKMDPGELRSERSGTANEIVKKLSEFDQIVPRE